MDRLPGSGLDDLMGRLGADAERLLEDLLQRAAGSPWATFQQPGDIVLTRGRRPLSHLNAVLQSMIEGGIARATHAMMVAAPGVYADASIHFGVTLLPAQSFSIDDVEERRSPLPGQGPVRRRRLVAAFRHPALAASPERQRRLIQAIAGQLGQPYNLRFVFKRVREPAQDGTAFCSELIARTFAGLGLPIAPKRRFAAVLPHTLLRHLAEEGWTDVSAAYRIGLQRAVG